MRIGILKEPADQRVAIVPETVAKFISLEHELLVEKGAGEAAFYRDADYEAAGAQVVSRETLLKEARMLIGIAPPSETELAALPAGTIVLATFDPRGQAARAARIKEMKRPFFTLDSIPRTSLAQSMDILSSMASLAGYKAVLMAANQLPGYFPMMMTAAGTVPPARVLILGAGVGGLQAIGTARRLGAIVEAFDVRSAVREEVESLGAKFIEVEGATEDKGAGGYAVEQSEAYQQRQKELIHERASKANVIISTANIPGRKAPELIEVRTVEAMQPGSVIVDLAAATGGNCSLTQNGQTISHHGVTIIGHSDLPSRMPRDASRLFSNNVMSYFKHVFKQGPDQLNVEDQITAETLIGEVPAATASE